MKFITNPLLVLSLLLFYNQIEAQAVIKLNVSSLGIGVVNLDGEYTISKNTSINIGVNGVLANNFTYSGDTYDFSGSIRGASIVPEFRFYVGRQGALHGFYLAPYANIARYSLPTITHELPSSTSFYPRIGTITDGKTNLLGLGGMIGAQWILGKNERFVLDWGIGGVGFNIASISGNETLNFSGNTEEFKENQLIPSFRGNVQIGVIL